MNNIFTAITVVLVIILGTISATYFYVPNKCHTDIVDMNKLRKQRMEKKIESYIRESLNYLKDHSYDNYLKKYALNKKSIEWLEKKLNTSIDYRSLVSTREELYHYFTNEIKEKKFDLKYMHIESIVIGQKEFNGLTTYNSEIKVSTKEHIAEFEIQGMLEYDGKILSNGTLNFNIIKNNIPNKYHTNIVDKNIYYSLERYEKACARSDEVAYTQEIQKKTLPEEVVQSEKKLGIQFPQALMEYWNQFSNGDSEQTNFDKFELFSHQKVMGIADFFDYYWKELQGVEEIDVFRRKDIDFPLNKEEKIFVKEINKKFFIFAVDWNDNLNFMEVLVFDKAHNVYGFVFDQDLVGYPYMEAFQHRKYKKHDDLNKFFTTYINLKISEEIDENTDVSVYNWFKEGKI